MLQRRRGRRRASLRPNGSHGGGFLLILVLQQMVEPPPSAHPPGKVSLKAAVPPRYSEKEKNETPLILREVEGCQRGSVLWEVCVFIPCKNI